MDRKEYNLQNKDKIKEYKKEWYLKNKDRTKEHKKAYSVEYRLKNKDKRKEYYLQNKDKIKEYSKEYRLKNKDKTAATKHEYMKKYKETPQYKKSQAIDNWKRYGLIDNYETVYDIYINTHECMKCNISISGTNKHMDHDHDTNLYRSVICSSCNTGNTLDIHPQQNNTVGIKYISTHQNGGYVFQKVIKKKRHIKYFKTLEEAIEYKKKYLLEFG